MKKTPTINIYTSTKQHNQMSYEKGVMYKLSVKLLTTGVLTTFFSIVVMGIMITSFDILINLTYLSLTSFMFGSGLAQLVIAIYLRLKAGKNPYLREELIDPHNITPEPYSSNNL